MPWYQRHRDLTAPEYCQVELYSKLADLERHVTAFESADLAIIGSYVPEGPRLIEWLLPRLGGVKAFYDIDTPVTVAKLSAGACDYLEPEQVPRFDLYLSFAGGPILERLRDELGAVRPRPFYCSVEPREYFPMPEAVKNYDLGYLGTYSTDRQPALERLLLEPARRWSEGVFYVAGAQYPKSVQWPGNVERSEHLPPARHCSFYNHQRFTLNITRADMVANGFSPSVRLFEAAACGVPIITDPWGGLEDFFQPGEILVARTTGEVLDYLHHLDEAGLQQIAARARQRVLAFHTADHRVRELEEHLRELAPAVGASQARAGTHDCAPRETGALAV
jgi:spore maturation protein CgeB